MSLDGSGFVCWGLVRLREGIGGLDLGLAGRFGVGWIDIMYMTESLLDAIQECHGLCFTFSD